MSTIFPGSASVGQVFDGYSFDGTAWNIIGIDLTENYLEESSASATYLTQVSASNTYLTQTSASTNYLTQSSASTSYTPSLILLSTQTLNGSVGAVNFSNVLSDTYTRYHVNYQLGCSVDNDMFFRFRENTTDKQASYYGSGGQTSYTGSSSVNSSSNLSYWYLGQVANTTNNYSTGWFNMYRRPSSPTVGIIHGQYMNSLNLASGNYSAGNYNMTNFNGFSIYVPSGNLNGKVMLYGYRD